MNPSSQPTSAASVPSFTKEVRFAVVMYGGVSLAIYINGVAQELLRMVRSTAAIDNESIPGSPVPIKGNQLKGTERVYRKISYLIGNEKMGLDKAEEALDEPILTRFVVDILSGTSAGGINGIFLAKAPGERAGHGTAQGAVDTGSRYGTAH